MEHIVNSVRGWAEEVQDYIRHVDAVREACVRAGEYRAAQECLDRIKEANIRFAQLLQHQATRYNAEEKRRLRDAHRLELLEHKKEWDERIRAYDEDAAQLLVQLERQQLLELQSADAALCAGEGGTPPSELQLQSDEALRELPDKRSGRALPDGRLLREQGHASLSGPSSVVAAREREVAELRQSLERLVRAQRYLEADKVKRELARAERGLTELSHSQRERRRQHVLRGTARRLREQHAAAQQRIDSGRQNLLRERDATAAELRQAHQATRERLAASTALARNMMTSFLREQLESYTADPARGNSFFITALLQPGSATTLRIHDDDDEGLERDRGRPSFLHLRR